MRTAIFRALGQLMITTGAALFLSFTVWAHEPMIPESPGDIAFTGSGATLDVSNAAEGYVTARYTGDSGKAKVRIIYGETVTTYGLRTDGEYEVYPLNRGDGVYRVIVYLQVHGNQYLPVLDQQVESQLRDPLLPFLYPNQFVNFDPGSQTVKKAGALAKDAPNKLMVVNNIYNYVVGNIGFDNDKATQAAAGQMGGYVTNVDDTLSSGKGICLDYAALTAAMLRSQGIPTRLETGYIADGVYHAWVSAYIPDTGWILLDPTLAASDPYFTGKNISYLLQDYY